MEQSKIDYENVGRFTINNPKVLEVWDWLVDWLKEKSVRGAVAYEVGKGGESPHLDITIQFKPMSYKIQSANLRERLRSKLKKEVDTWSIKKHKVKPPTHRYELLVAGYAKKEIGNPEFKYVEWGHEDIDLVAAEEEYKQRVITQRLVPVHSQNWWAICMGVAKEMKDKEYVDYHLKDVLRYMFNSHKYDMKYLLNKLTKRQERLFQMMVDKKTMTTDDTEIFFVDEWN